MEPSGTGAIWEWGGARWDERWGEAKNMLDEVICQILDFHSIISFIKGRYYFPFPCLWAVSLCLLSVFVWKCSTWHMVITVRVFVLLLGLLFSCCLPESSQCVWLLRMALWGVSCLGLWAREAGAHFKRGGSRSWGHLCGFCKCSRGNAGFTL